MKKVIAILVMMVTLLTLSLGVQAHPLEKEKKDKKILLSSKNLKMAVQKANMYNAETMISVSSNKVKTGEFVTLTAVTPKKGSTFVDKWDGADGTSIDYDFATESYISTAVFEAKEPGTYVVSYDIEMTAGDSDTSFYASAVQTIEVVDEATVTKIGIKDLVITPLADTAGNTTGYYAMGNLYVLWSNGTEESYSTIFCYFSKSETVKTISGSLTINGQVYPYAIDITR